MPGVKLGFVVPTWTTTSLSWRDVLEVSHAAVDVGFDSLWVTDHLLQESTNAELRHRAGLSVPEAAEELAEGYLECFSTLAALAAALPTVQLGSFVACARYRNPALLGKMADNIDSISDGRFVLGVGAGDSEEEHQRFGFPTDHSVSHFQEHWRSCMVYSRMVNWSSAASTTRFDRRACFPGDLGRMVRQ